MAHGTVLNQGAGGDTVPSYDLSLSTAPTLTSGKVPPGFLFTFPDASSAPALVTDANPLQVAPKAMTKGGATPFNMLSAASTNATSVKGSAGTVYNILATNTNASARFLKLYDKATAPTVGTDTPVFTALIPATNGIVNMSVPVGIAFANGIALAITGAVTLADTTAVGANDVSVNLTYK